MIVSWNRRRIDFPSACPSRIGLLRIRFKLPGSCFGFPFLVCSALSARQSCVFCT